MTQPTVIIKLADSYVTMTKSGELAETVETDVTGQPDWADAAVADQRGAGGPAGYAALWQAVTHAERAAKLSGYDVNRLEL